MEVVAVDIQHLLITAPTAQITSIIGLLTSHLAKSCNTYNFSFSNDTKNFCSRCTAGPQPIRFSSTARSTPPRTQPSASRHLEFHSREADQSYTASYDEPADPESSPSTSFPEPEVLSTFQQIKEEVEDTEEDYSSALHRNHGDATPIPPSGQDMSPNRRDDGCVDDEPSTSMTEDSISRVKNYEHLDDMDRTVHSMRSGEPKRRKSNLRQYSLDQNTGDSSRKRLKQQVVTSCPDAMFPVEREPGFSSRGDILMYREPETRQEYRFSQKYTKMSGVTSYICTSNRKGVKCTKTVDVKDGCFLTDPTIGHGRTCGPAVKEEMKGEKMM